MQNIHSQKNEEYDLLTGRQTEWTADEICTSHLIIEIQIYESWDTLGKLCHLSHCLGRARLAAAEETQLHGICRPLDAGPRQAPNTTL